MAADIAGREPPRIAQAAASLLDAIGADRGARLRQSACSSSPARPWPRAWRTRSSTAASPSSRPTRSAPTSSRRPSRSSGSTPATTPRWPPRPRAARDPRHQARRRRPGAPRSSLAPMPRPTIARDGSLVRSRRSAAQRATPPDALDEWLMLSRPCSAPGRSAPSGCRPISSRRCARPSAIPAGKRPMRAMRRRRSSSRDASSMARRRAAVRADDRRFPARPRPGRPDRLDRAADPAALHTRHRRYLSGHGILGSQPGRSRQSAPGRLGGARGGPRRRGVDRLRRRCHRTCEVPHAAPSPGAAPRATARCSCDGAL